MSKLLYNGEIYEELSPSAFYESEYETLVFAHAESLYPEYHMIDFKTVVYSDNGAAKADFALIHKQYRDWWVGEIEVGNHSLEGHVLPQVEVLSMATYTQREADFIYSKRPCLEIEKLSDIMKGQQPRVLVIVNTPCPKWIKPLEKNDAILAVFEIFKSFRDKYIFRINGEHPSPFTTMVSDCKSHNLIPRLLQILSPGILPIRANEKVSIKCGDGYLDWMRTDIHDAVYLSPLKTNPLRTRKNYELRLHENGTLELLEQKIKRRI